MRRRSFLVGAFGIVAANPLRAVKSLGTIAYVEFGGLTVRTLPDGEPRKVLDFAVSSPRFSPSGKWILYTQNDNAYVVTIDGKKVQRVGDAAVWAPGGDELWARNDATDSLEQFSAGDDFSSPTASIAKGVLGVFSPSGAEMIYADTDQTGAGDELRMVTNLYRVPLKDGAKPAILETTEGDWTPHIWTRDGKSLVHWRQDEFSASEASDGDKLFVMPAAGGKGRDLGVVTLLDHDFVSLSPARDELAVTAGGGRYQWYNKRLAVVDLETSAVRYLTTDNLVAFSPAWSPDGNKIAYSAGPAPKPGEEDDLMGGDDEGEKRLNALFAMRRIWIADRTGAPPPRPLTNDDRYHDEEPLWSADGAHVLFTRGDGAYKDIEEMSSDNQALWLVAADGATPVKVTGTLYVDPDAGGPEMRRAAFDWLR